MDNITTQLQIGDKIKFKYNKNEEDTSIGYIYYIDEKRTEYFVSQNKNIKDIGFCENWIVKTDDIICLINE